MTQIQARFTQGSILRHIIIMTLSSAVGLTFTFVIDFVTLFWITRLGNEAMNASVAIAGALMFFNVSFAIAFMIPTVALVARSLGRADIDKAKQFATGSLILSSILLLIIALFLLSTLEISLPVIGAGASERSIQYSKTFLVIALPSILLFGIGVTTSAILRAEGDAKRSMYVMLCGAIVAMIVDPIFIVYLNGGVAGAAWGFVVSRLAMAMLGIYYIGVKYGFLVDPRHVDFAAFAPPFFAIAIPAILTQASTPIGNIILTRAMSPFGDEALAGFAVSFRLMLLGFGGIFALSGAIGGIIGQNYGAGHLGRVRETYVKAIGFGALYAVFAWAILLILQPHIGAIFRIQGDALIVSDAFLFTAWYFIFVSALFVSNAAFNNLGRPIWATGTNWLRDVVLTYPMLFLIVPIFGAAGVMYTQALVGVLAGSTAALIGWRYLKRVERGEAQVERVKK